MRVLVSLPGNCGNNPGWADWSWSTYTSASVLLSVSFLMDPYLFPFVIHFLLLSVPNIHDAQIGTFEEHRSLGGSIVSRLYNGAFVGLIY